MPHTIIESVLNGKFSVEVIQRWLNNDLNEGSPEDCALFCCNRNEFVAYFLSYLRNQTDRILQTNTNALQVLQHQNTPEKLFSSKRQHRRSISEPNTSEQEADQAAETPAVKDTRTKPEESPSKERSHKKPSRRVKTKLFLEAEPLHKSRSHENSLNRSTSSGRTDSDESRVSTGIERIAISSTPMKNGLSASEFPYFPISSPVTPNESNPRSLSRNSSCSQLPKEHHDRCDTPKLNPRSRISSHEKSTPSLGDYIVNAQTSKSTKKKKNSAKNISNESADGSRVELDLSSSDMFPEIGAKRLSSSLRGDREKRRIKPTNLDSRSKRSFSLNSFNAEVFQQPSPVALQENLAFKEQHVQPTELSNSYEAERKMLKVERHKLMEKFNILNDPTSPKVPKTPQYNILRKDTAESKYVKATATLITFREKIDFLIDIYDYMLKTNCVLSISTEIYFLMCLLLSRQYEEDYVSVESKLTLESDDKVVAEHLLRSIHNCSYFAVKTLWRQKYVLELMLDKSSLKLLGENRHIRSYYPDLAKFLLNLYGLKCDAESLCQKDEKPDAPGDKFNNEVVCFNFETDNADNFPCLFSFQNFRKQRDLFCEILRWWWNPEKQSGCVRTSLRYRVKSLLSLSSSPANHAHLARLVRDYILAECGTNLQESKLSKLQRRLIGPATPSGPESNRLPRFTPREQFYKDLILFAENDSFRSHLRDAMATELLTLDSSASFSERSNSSPSHDLSKEYLAILKKLRLLAKFLGFLISLPYTQVPVDHSMKTGMPCGVGQAVQTCAVPKEKVLENDIAVRNYSQPPIDVKATLTAALESRRLSITLPWLTQYLAMLDYTSLRIRYYTDVIRSIFCIYNSELKVDSSCMKRSMAVFLQLCLGWLFDMPQFPHDLYYESSLEAPKGVVRQTSREDVVVDHLDMVDENVLFEVCPYLKEFNVLLLVSGMSVDKGVGSFRHITPVTMTLNPGERIRGKEKEIQAKLEEELIKSQPSSTRRVLEMVTDRVTSATIKELTVTVLQQSRSRAKVEAVHVTRLWRQMEVDQSVLLANLRSIYEAELRVLRAKALEAAVASVSTRAGMALQALLAGGSVKQPLQAVARRGSLANITKWLDDNWGTVSILCKDIPGEMNNLIVLGDSLLPVSPLKVDLNTDDDFEKSHPSPANNIIKLKELICLLLDGEPCKDVASILDVTSVCCSTKNMFARPPTTSALHQLVCELCIVYISRRPHEFNQAFLVKVNAVWDMCCPDRRRDSRVDEEVQPERDFGDEIRAPTPDSDDEVPRKSPAKIVLVKPNQDKPSKVDTTSAKDPLLQYFERVLCPRNIILLSSSPYQMATVWEKVAELLVFLLKYDYLTEDSLTEQCLAVYRQDWPQNVLENLSSCMRTVSYQWGRSVGGKFTLFLDFLAEYCNDMDYEQDNSIMS